jgi:hypothetical protein
MAVILINQTWAAILSEALFSGAESLPAVAGTCICFRRRTRFTESGPKTARNPLKSCPNSCKKDSISTQTLFVSSWGDI